MDRVRRWLHDKLGWGYPGAMVDYDPVQSTWECRYCTGRLTKDSQFNWFHLTKGGSR